FTVAAGRVVGLIGPNGAGKSTSLHGLPSDPPGTRADCLSTRADRPGTPGQRALRNLAASWTAGPESFEFSRTTAKATLSR
ncbi:ATP-binding cassette domain-containing protein, partial [Amycolatopsis sp. NPDC004169]|uniref:ATP-binding cassette domain-containing protein n=1 Tax=Amycolatopsis sp. NPDC004169 TaxID=3154453 RepID=UPI0033A57B35